MTESNVTIIVSLIIGVSSILSRVFKHRYDRFEPLFKLGLGIVAGIVYINPNSIRFGILDGIIVGLAANGFSGYAKGIKDGYTTLKAKTSSKKKL